MFEDTRLYPARDDALRILGTYQTLAHWRSAGTGPAYVKVGAKVFYTGRDLNAWLEAQTVRPGEATEAA